MNFAKMILTDNEGNNQTKQKLTEHIVDLFWDLWYFKIVKNDLLFWEEFDHFPL
jgi:hypothetical protein